MKEFFKKVWRWLKAAPSKLYGAFVKWLNSIRRDRLYHFIAGLIIAAFCSVVWDMGFWAFIPALCAGVIKEFIDQWRSQSWDWVDLFATILGGLLIGLFGLI